MQTDENSNLPGSTPQRKRRGILMAVVLVIGVALAVVFVTGSREVDDATLRSSLIGTWRAVDVDNAALHHRKSGVAAEEAVFSDNGNLVYRVDLKPGEGEPMIDPYGWEIIKGKLQLRYMGKESAGETLPRIRVTVEGSRLSIRRKGYPEKIFERVGPQHSDG